MTNDERVLELIKAKKEGLKIVYGDKVFSLKIEDDHVWNLNNTYKIIRPREYIISIPDDGREPFIERTSNTWTRSDFGKSGNTEYILMREVFKEDME